VLTDDDVQPFLGRGGAFDEDGVLAELEQQEREPDAFGRFVIEVLQDGDWRKAGTLGFERVNRRKPDRAAGAAAVHPAFRGRRLADDAARLFQRT
jgi:RimJ/RimL family protein N-acetyltransferase